MKILHPDDFLAEEMDRFWTLVNRDGPIPSYCPEVGKCWLWMGSMAKFGYGKFCTKFKSRAQSLYAHRLSWVFTFREPIKSIQFICHKCDNPGCVNPKHLFIGTAADNVHDMWNKGRQVMLRGEEKGTAKLKPAEIEAIMNLLSEGHTNKVIAEKFGITPALVALINRGAVWRHMHDGNGFTPPKRIMNRARGEIQGSSKLKESDIIEIRRLLKDRMSLRGIASLFNVSRDTIRKIKFGVTWRHVAG